MIKPALSKAELRAQLEAALSNYHGTVTHCPPGSRPEPEPRSRTSRMTIMNSRTRTLLFSSWKSNYGT
jgi:hypothetical protein